ncbi:MAG TPA: S8 family serine peptidase, partial [Solirubrobacterales bacterium]|nr:S8 family serine peptidase [Solirubrobacterales bacterium]
RFCGTSAAAPHAAAVAALVRQAEPTLTEPQVRSTLTNLATPVGAFTPEAAGAGLVDAFEAIGSLPGPIVGGDGPGGSVPPVEPPPSEEPPTEPEEPPVDPEDPPTPETPSSEAPPTSGDEPRVTPPSQGTRQPPPAPVPDTRILQRPPKLVRARAAGPRLVFRFGSDQPNVTYVCKVDRAPFRACSSRLTRRFAPGRHLLKVKARTTGGQVDPTPAVVRFRVAAAG